MHTNIIIKKAPVKFGLLFSLLLCWGALSGQNVAMHFDGDNDWIFVNPINNHNPAGDFTVEMWFQSTATNITGGNCSGNFRRLFSVGAPNDRFEVGECDGILSVFLNPGPGTVQSTINVRDNQWHCIAAVRSGPVIDIYYDGNPVAALSGLAAGTFSGTRFTVGHWPGGLTPGQDWQGYVDEVKFWSTALSPTDLTACSACLLPCNEPNLTLYWHFDEGIPNGNNTALTQVDDCTANNNNGNIFLAAVSPPAFALTGTVSNFVPSSAPVLYPDYANLHVKLTDPTQSGISIAGICEGEPVHFAIVDANGTPVSASGNATVQWQYSDDCTFGSPVNIPGSGSPSALFSGFSFVSPPNNAVLNCAGLTGAPTPNGFVDRCFRAIITVNNGITSCSYVVDAAQLRICCKVPPVSLNVTPPGPLCEGDVVTFTSTISGIPAPSSSNNYQISWCVTINGTPTNLTGPLYDNQLSISYGAVTLVPGTYCFKATVSNCLCPPVTLQQCFTVDPKPVCGTIKVVLPNAALTPDPDGNPDHWLICPYNTAELMEDLPFTNCIPIWQFMFPNAAPGVWTDLGVSNGMQNTNILPQLKPGGSPYLWPSAPNFPVFPVDETCIVYRIECRPYSYPNSGCPPCYSNEIRICLKQPPAPPSIAVSPTQLCKNGGGLFNFTVQSTDPNCTYEWYSNGLLVGFGDFLNTPNAGCYWVTCNDGCFTTASNKLCVDLCEVVAAISCPMPDCPMLGDVITLDAAQFSFSTCNLPLTYMWSWIDMNGMLQTSTSSIITDIPAMCGTVYTLTVTDSLGCSDTTQVEIVPCKP